MPTATLPAAAAPPTEQPPTPASLTTAPPPPPPTATPAPTPTDQSPPPLTPTPTIPGLWLFDDFENPDNDGKFDEGLWNYFSEAGNATTVEQKNGSLTLSHQSPDNGGLNYYGPFRIDEIGFVEARLKLDSNIKVSGGNINFNIWNYDWWLACAIHGKQEDSDGWANCTTSDDYEGNGVTVSYNSWHTMRFEVNSDTTVSFFLDNHYIGTYTPPDKEAFKQTQVTFALAVNSGVDGLITGSIDDVRVGKAQAGVSEVDPATVYDNFNNPANDGVFDKERWILNTDAPGPAIIEQKHGSLRLSRQSPGLHGLDHYPVKINEVGFVEVKFTLDRNMEASGGVAIQIWSPPWTVSCDLNGQRGSDEASASCRTDDGFWTNTVSVPYNEKHILRFEINPDTAAISFFVNGKQFHSDYIPSNPEEFRQADFYLSLRVWSSEDGGLVTGYADDVRIGRLGQ
ncbi:MAG: hypothetical protein HC875_36520 [Anaerolineales bacterium]|nr:hypothetical protein [Anaerolineales bacterium]